MGDISLQQAVDEFETINMPARNLASRTRVEYLNDLNAFVKFLENAGYKKVGELSPVLVDRYLARLDELGFSGATRKRKAITFRSFFSFLFRSGYLNHDISQQVVLPFSEYPIPRVLTQSEYNKLLDVCSGNARDKALITLLLQTGSRLSELIRLTLSDVHLPDSIDIRESGSRKGRSIPLNSNACEALKSYFSAHPSSTILFPSKTGKPLESRGVEKILAKYFRQTGIYRASVRTLRHTFAVQHIMRGTSLKTIQKILGHQDVRTTELYLPLANEAARKELEQNAL